MDPIPSSTELNEQSRIMLAPTDNSGSFTALLELPTPQAMELLYSSETGHCPVTLARDIHIGDIQSSETFNRGGFAFPTNSALIECAARYSVYPANSSPETSSMSASSKQNVKAEPTESELKHDSSQRLVADPIAGKRKDREKKGKGSSKKSKNDSSVDAQMLPYVHVRARRGQATDSHSLAERARREKINARMKLLQELVPGCNKISGTALVLDEIINHVQSLQCQVEFLSMRLAAVNPGVDFNFDGILAAEGGSLVDSNFSGMVVHPLWPEFQISGTRQQYQHQLHFDSLNQPVWGRERENHSFVAPVNSLLSYDASVNAVSSPSNQMKMEL